MKKQTQIIFKWGLLLGVGLSVLQLAKLFSDGFDFYAFGPVIDLFNVLLYIGILYMGLKEIKSECFNNEITFTQSFARGLLLIFVSFFVVFIYLNIQYGLIAPQQMEVINQKNIEEYKNKLGKDSITTQLMDQYLIAEKEFITQKQNTLLEQGVIDSTGIEILKAHLDEITQMHQYQISHPTDTSQKITLEKFDDYTHKNWISILNVYIPQIPKDDTIAPYIHAIIAAIPEEGKSFSPFTVRFEAEKEKIPQFTNSFAASLFYSLSIILYGVFFNIFVSIYLYHRKKKVSNEE